MKLKNIKRLWLLWVFFIKKSSNIVISATLKAGLLVMLVSFIIRTPYKAQYLISILSNYKTTNATYFLLFLLSLMPNFIWYKVVSLMKQ